MTAQIEESYTVEQASEHAKEWGKAHPGWQRICDIADSDKLYKTYAELTKRQRAAWDREGGEAAWKEWGSAPCKFPKGYISGKGEFYRNVLDVPRFHNLMTVYKTGART